VGAGRPGSHREGRGGRRGPLPGPPHPPNLPDFPGPPGGPRPSPRLLGRRSRASPWVRPHPRGARQAPAQMSALFPGAGATDRLVFPVGPRSAGRGLSASSFAGVCSGLWWPNLAVMPKRCRRVTTMMITIINSLNFNSFGGPCLLAVYSSPVTEHCSVVLLNLQNWLVTGGLLTLSRFIDVGT
jgi:hypothetical protein